MSQIALTEQVRSGPQEAPLLGRFVAKILVDVMPTAAASLVVGCLLTQYQLGHRFSHPAPAAESGPASAAMMQLVRDEHAAMMGYLKAQAVAERSRHAAEDKADAEAVAEAKADEAAAATAATDSHRVAAVVVTPVPNVARIKVGALAAAPVSSPAPLAIAQTEPSAGAAPPPSPAPLAIAQTEQSAGAAPAAVAVPPRVSLLTKTVHATLHVVSAIGGIPNLIASMGDHIGGAKGATDAIGEMRQMISTSS